jgi:hypothetical protein
VTQFPPGEQAIRNQKEGNVKKLFYASDVLKVNADISRNASRFFRHSLSGNMVPAFPFRSHASKPLRVIVEFAEGFSDIHTRIHEDLSLAVAWASMMRVTQSSL